MRDNMTTTSSYPTDPYQRGPALSRRFLPLGLITLGVVFLLSNLLPEGGRGGLILLGLGAAFLIGRVTTGRYGYAVPAGLLIAIGTYVSLKDTQSLGSVQGGGWFFILLAFGFALVYLIGLRPSAVWPLFPATVLAGLALVLFGVGSSLTVLAALSWTVAYWPMALVLLGAWLLVRDHLPVPLQRPIATLGGLALLAYGIVAAAASVATGGVLARSDLALGFGSSPLVESVTLDVPIAAGQTFNVDNSSGRTSVHAGTGSSVHVVATKHFAVGGHAQDVKLTPDGSGVSLSASNPNRGFPFGFGGSGSWVDYAIEVPAAVQVNAKTSSGQIDIDGVNQAVNAQSSSGALNLMNLGGAAQAHSSSGAIELSNVAGTVKVSTSSGPIRATQISHLGEASTNSGSMSLEGTFTEAANIQANSGTVNLKLLPGSAVQLDVKTGSGSVVPQGLSLANGASRNNLTGAIGTPASGAVLSIQTGSGSVLISQ
jgi:hypothetical protein